MTIRAAAFSETQTPPVVRCVCDIHVMRMPRGLYGVGERESERGLGGGGDKERRPKVEWRTEGG